MNPQLVIPVIWSLAAALVVKLWTAWSRLPDRVAVHFSIAMQPNRWSSKNTLATSILLAILGQASLATWLILRVNSAGIVALIQLVVSVVLVCAFWQVLNYNAMGRPFRGMWVLVPTMLLLAGITVFLLSLLFGYYRS